VSEEGRGDGPSRGRLARAVVLQRGYATRRRMEPARPKGFARLEVIVAGDLPIFSDESMTILGITRRASLTLARESAKALAAAPGGG
jgi:hypothetical protein